MLERELKISQPNPIVLENPSLGEVKRVVYNHTFRPGHRISCIWDNNGNTKTSAAIPYQMTEKGLYLFFIKEASSAGRLIVDELIPEPFKEATLSNLSDEEIRRITEFQAKKPNRIITYIWENNGLLESLTIVTEDYRYKKKNWRKRHELFRRIRGANKIIIKDISPTSF